MRQFDLRLYVIFDFLAHHDHPYVRLWFKVHLPGFLCVDGLAGVGGAKGLGEVDQRFTEANVANLSILYLIFWIVVQYL